MSEAQHTPGPWVADVSMVSGRVKNSVFSGPHKNQILSTARDPYGDDNAVAEANARLIAAAPDLLAALEDLLTFDRVERPAFRSKPMGASGSEARIQQDKMVALEDAARAAIAKATGAA
jgi:hypothetical protein